MEDNPELYNAVLFLQEPHGTQIANAYHTSMRPRLPYDFEVAQFQRRWLVPPGEILDIAFKLRNWGLEDDTYHLALSGDVPPGWEFFFDCHGDPLDIDVYVPAFDDSTMSITLVAPSEGVCRCLLSAAADGIPGRIDTVQFEIFAGGDVLLVCDSPTPDDSLLYKPCLEELGVNYIYWDTGRDGALINLSELQIERVVWFCGEDTSDNIRGAECNSLGEFVNSGGRLILTGSGIGRANYTAFSFFSNALGARYDGVADTFARVFGTEMYPFIGYTGTLDSAQSAEVFSPIESQGGYSILQYPDGVSAAVAKDDIGRALILGFPPERLAGHGFAELFLRAWEFLDIGWSGIAEKSLPSAPAISVHPNPFNDACVIRVSGIGNRESANIAIYDIRGMRICAYDVGARHSGAQMQSGEAQSGNASPILWRPDKNIASGIYIIRATFGGRKETKKLLYIR